MKNMVDYQPAPNLAEILANIKQIERAKHEWEVTADALPQLICLLNAQGHVLRANRTVETWHLGQVDQIKGRTVHELLHPQCPFTPCYFQSLWERLWAEVKQGKTVIEEVQDKQLNRYLEIQLHPTNLSLHDRFKETDSFAVLIIQDTTMARAMQQHQELEARLAGLGQMAAGFSHYFNNILTTIIGFSELLQLNPDLSESAKNDLSLIIRQGHRAAHLISQILDFSRQSISQKELLNLAQLLPETIDMLQTTTPPTIQLKSTIGPGDFSLHADPNQLRQILMNVTLNAWDAMPDGGVVNFHLYRVISSALTAAHKPQLAMGDWIAISISDNGLGIDHKHQARLLEPFFTTKETGKGTGLGLAQVYGLLQQHGGEIEIKSEPGVGTTVYIYLPAV